MGREIITHHAWNLLGRESHSCHYSRELVRRKFRYSFSSLLVMSILTYTYAMSVPSNETVPVQGILIKTSLFISNAIPRVPSTNDDTTPSVLQETAEDKSVQNDTKIRTNDLLETNNSQTAKDNPTKLQTLDIVQITNDSNKTNDFSKLSDFMPWPNSSDQSTAVSTQSPSSIDSYKESYINTLLVVTTPSDKLSITKVYSAESARNNISSDEILSSGIENAEGNTSSTDSTITGDFFSEMSKFNFNSEKTMVVDLSTNTSANTTLIIDASAKVRIVDGCHENGRVYLQGDVVDVGQIGDCCYFWYCDSHSDIVYHEIPCLDHPFHSFENLQMCVWEEQYYKPGEDILLENLNGLCHGIHCTCDAHVIELYGYACNVMHPITDVKLNVNNTVLSNGVEYMQTTTAANLTSTTSTEATT